jgi:hypothetical protein
MLARIIVFGAILCAACSSTAVAPRSTDAASNDGRDSRADTDGAAQADGPSGDGRALDSLICLCPSDVSIINVPKPLSESVVNATGDVCTITYQAGVIAAQATSAVVCHVTLDLAGGSTTSATLTFASEAGANGCCASYYHVASEVFPGGDAGVDSTDTADSSDR